MIRKLFVLCVLGGMLLLAGCGPKAVTMNLDLVEYSFTPNLIEVPAGAEVTVTMQNKGTLEHELVIMLLGQQVTTPFDDDDEPNIYWEHELQPGKVETVTFTAPAEKGTYQVVCGIPTHVELGMVATLIVK